jgi:hypothetical protein
MLFSVATRSKVGLEQERERDEHERDVLLYFIFNLKILNKILGEPFVGINYEQFH